jgi:hypothetical protein
MALARRRSTRRSASHHLWVKKTLGASSRGSASHRACWRRSLPQTPNRSAGHRSGRQLPHPPSRSPSTSPSPLPLCQSQHPPHARPVHRVNPPGPPRTTRCRRAPLATSGFHATPSPSGCSPVCWSLSLMVVTSAAANNALLGENLFFGAELQQRLRKRPRTCTVHIEDERWMGPQRP